MKFLLLIFLIIPNIIFGSELDARKLYIDAKMQSINNGCNVQTIVLKVSSSLMPSQRGNDLTGLTKAIFCLENYQNNILPIYEEILTKYPYSEVSYDLLSGFFLDRQTFNELEILLLSSLQSDFKITNLKELSQMFNSLELMKNNSKNSDTKNGELSIDDLLLQE